MIPKIIWTYWDNPDIHPLISKIINTWNKYCKSEEGWKIIILNKNTINQYLQDNLDYPSNIWNHIPQYQSDMFGTSLVKKYGGIWMDANIIMTGSIDFILEKELFYYYDEKNNNPEVFLFAATENNYAIDKIHKIFYEIFSYDKDLIKDKLNKKYNIDSCYVFPQLLINYLMKNDKKIEDLIVNNTLNQWTTIYSLMQSMHGKIKYKSEILGILNKRYYCIPENIKNQPLHKLQGANMYTDIKINTNSWLHKLLEGDYSNIPKIVWQTWKDSNVEPEVQNNINKMKKLNPEYDFKLVTDIECDKFIKEHFNSEIYEAYSSINPKYGAAKADFWRYCVLYVNGGVYLDLDSFIEEKLCNIINETDEVLINLEMWNFPVNKNWHSSFSDADKIQTILGYDKEKINTYLKNIGFQKQLAQNILIYRPRHPFLLEVINEVVSNINKWKQIEANDEIKSSISKTIHITGPSAYTLAINRCIYENKNNYNYRILNNNLVKFRISEEFTNNMYKNNPNNYKNMDEEPFIIKNKDIKETESEIPRIIWQTYDDIESIPQKVYDNIKKYGEGYQHIIMNDNQCKQILSVFGKEYVEAFDNLKLGCHKADLFRYACLYLCGGIYLDIKIELQQPLDKIITHKDHFYCCLCQNGIFNGFIACKPKLDIFISLMKTMIIFSKSDQSDYFITVKDFYNKISEYMKKSHTPCVCPGSYEHIKLTIFYNNTNRNPSIEEKKDRYGLVCKGHSYNGNIIFNTRYNDFPWKKYSNIVTFNIENLNVTLYKNDCYITNSFYKNIYWDIDILSKLKQYIDPSKNILEIGGHCGTSSLIYSKYINNSSKIFVYEPQKNMYNLLKKNIEQNNLQEKIIPYNNCIFCDEIEVEMNDIDLDGNRGVKIKDMYNEGKPCNFGGTCLGKGGEKVKAVVLDKLDHENIGFIHCDAQGAENFIFAGGKEFIKKHKPVIFYENNCKYPEFKYLYDNICKCYPTYEKESVFNLEQYCVDQLGYQKVISRFGDVDDLLIPDIL